MTEVRWLPEAREALIAIAALARFDRSGAAIFGDDPAQTARSFRACVFAFPLFLFVRFGNLLIAVPAMEHGTALLLVQTLEFVIEALVFPLAALPLLRWYGREDRWCRLVTAYNWWGLGQAILITAIVMLHRATGGAPVAIELLLISYLFCLVVEVFIIEIVLGAGFFTAATLVLIDVAISQVVTMIAQAIV